MSQGVATLKRLIIVLKYLLDDRFRDVLMWESGKYASSLSSHSRVSFLTSALFLGGIYGCGEFDPELGDIVGLRCVNEDSNPGNVVSFSQDIQPIFTGDSGEVGCSCHLPNTQDPIGIQLGGLDLSSYRTLREGGNNSGTDVVVENSPCESDIILKLRANPPFGSRMPFDGPPMLANDKIQLISDWIAEGAKNDG